MSRSWAMQLGYPLLLLLTCVGIVTGSTLIPDRPDAKTNADVLAGQRAHLLQDLTLYEQSTGETVSDPLRSFIEQAVDHRLYGSGEREASPLITRCLQVNETFDEHPLAQLRAADVLYQVGRTGASRRLLLLAEQAIGTIGTLPRAHAECLGLLAEIEYECGFFGNHRPFYVTYDRALLAYAKAVNQTESQRLVLAMLAPRYDRLTDIADKEAFARLFWDAEAVHDWSKRMLMGRYHRDLAWQIRGDGDATTVDWPQVERQLEQAAEHFRIAYRAAPSMPESAAQLIMITAALGNDAEAPRTWFERSVSAQVDYGPAYHEYVAALRPPQGGSLDQLQAFGEACRDTGRFDTDIPLQYVHVLRAMAETREAPATPGDNTFHAPVARLLSEAAADPARANPRRGLVPRTQLLSAQLNHALNQNQETLAQQLDAELLETYDPAWSEQQGLGARRKRQIELAMAMPPDVAEQAVKLRLQGAASADDAGRFEELARLYRESADSAENSRTARLLQQLALEAESQVDFYQGKWTKLPFVDDAWMLAGGTWTFIDDQTVEGRRARDSRAMMLYSDNRYPGPLEVEVEMEMLDAYGVQPRAGLVIGYLPLLRSTEEFSGEQPHGRCFWIDPVRGWTGAGVVAGPTTIYAAPRQSRYTLRVKAWPGFYAVSINGQFVFQGQATPFQPDGYVGIGALSHSRSSNECRFENLRVRRLMLEPPPLNEPPANRIAYFTNALRQDPDDEWALAMRGAAYQEQGEAEAAVADLTQVVDTEDPSPRFAIVLALAHGQAGQYAEAVALFERHLNGPAEMVASHGLAWLLATCPDARLRDGARAVTLAQKACKKVDYEDGDRLDTLAAAYAEQGNFEEAVRWQRKSIEFPKGRRGLNERRDRLKRYQGKQPFRLPVLPAAPTGTSPGG